MFVLNHQLEFLTFYTKGYPYQPNWGIIECNSKGWDASTDMTYNATTGTYSISLGLTTGELKFRLDNSWATNFGDDGNNLSLDAGSNTRNCRRYTITANFTTKTYTITRLTNGVLLRCNSNRLGCRHPYGL
jgi:hypothetical protein